MSDTSQGPGWWQAADGKWYSPDTPPAPGWWRASDGNWYPPADAPAPADAAPADAAPAEAATDTPAPAAEEPAPAAPTPAAPPPVAPEPVAAGAKGGGKGGLIAAAVVAVLLLIVGVVFVATRKSSDTVATGSGGSGQSGQTDGGNGSSGDDGNNGNAGQPNPDLSDEMPSPDLTLADDVKVVDSKQGAMFKGFSSDGLGMLIDKAAPGIDQVQNGDVIILSGITVVRVASVDPIDEGIVITGEPVTLPEVIEEGDLEWSDVTYDPEKMRLKVWDDSGAAEGEGSSSGGSSDGGATEDSIVEDGGGQIVDGLGGASLGPASGPAVATPIVARVRGVETTFALPQKTVSGKVGEFTFDLTYEPEGSGAHIVLVLDSSGDLDGKITTDVHLGALASSGGAKVKGKQVRNFDFQFSELGGEAKITTELRSTKNTTSVMTPPFLQVPFSIEFPALVGGIPFTLSLTGTIQVQLSMALANASLGGEVNISFGGDAGMKFDGGSLTINGKRQQSAEDTIKTVQGLSGGPVGIVFTTELPKVGFGFGFLQTGAGVYISNGMVAQQSVLPMPAACTGLQIAYVLAAGVEAKFLGKEFDIGRKAIVDKRWDYTIPKTERCMKQP